MIFLIIIMGTLCIVIYVFYKNTPDNNQNYLKCKAGQCVTNIFNGEKKCSNEELIYDPVYQVCNSKYTCENPRTPIALLNDGSTNIMGICDKDTICRCVTKSRCSNDIVTMFIKNDVKGEDFTLNQLSLEYQGNGGSQYFEFDDTNTNFCAIKAFHLNRISPGACLFQDPNLIEINELETCFRKNPCQIGVLTFYPKNSDSFVLNPKNTDSIYTIPVACVASINNPNNTNMPLQNYCNHGSVPVYNKKTELIECKSTL